MKGIVLIGYSGHAFVVVDSALESNRIIHGYHEFKEKEVNPYKLKYLGVESIDSIQSDKDYFIAIGDNQLRRKIHNNLKVQLTTIISPSAYISNNTVVKEGGLVAPKAIINSQSEIGVGVIINSGAIVEHECVIGDFAHVAPGATLCGNVNIGENTLIGANATVLPGVKIGKNCIVGAGSVVTKDISDNSVSFGNPNQII